jgi:hypothetical protein
MAIPRNLANLAPRLSTTGGSFSTTIGVGGATPSASGAGITFPASQSASTDANTLDDYEEGTWTPTVAGTSSAGVGTYSNQVGRYTKIGNRVYVDIILVWTAHTGTGNMQVSNLPFTVLNSTFYFPPLASLYNNVTLTAGNIGSAVFILNSTVIELNQQPTGGGGFSSIPMDTAGEVRLQGNYIAN